MLHNGIEYGLMQAYAEGFGAWNNVPIGQTECLAYEETGRGTDSPQTPGRAANIAQAASGVISTA
jgi:hypothetical protein